MCVRLMVLLEENPVILKVVGNPAQERINKKIGEQGLYNTIEVETKQS